MTLIGCECAHQTLSYFLLFNDQLFLFPSISSGAHAPTIRCSASVKLWCGGSYTLSGLIIIVALSLTL